MSIDSISPSYSPYQTNETQNPFLQIRKNVEQMGQALNSGDLTAAQTAYSSLRQLLPSSTADQEQTGQQVNQSAFSADFDALGQALQSGDLAKAQEAFARLQQDAQSAQKGHHHHHHHKAVASQNSASSSDSSPDSGNANNGGSESGRKIDVTT